MPAHPRPPATVGAALQITRERLFACGIQEAPLEAELLVAAAVGQSREWLLLHPEAPLSPRQEAELDSLVARRCRREPLPYLLGRAEFYGLSLFVTPEVLVPRPETELLVEAAAARARPLAARLAVDVGAGSGAVAVALAKELPRLRVIAVDLSLGALRVAQENARRHGVGERVLPVCADLLDALAEPADCLVANLPYVRTDEFPGLQPEVRDWEPRLALDGGPDGTGPIRRLCAQAWGHLRTGGVAAVEVGTGQAAEVANLLAAEGFQHVETLPDYAGIPRVVVGWRKG